MSLYVADTGNNRVQKFDLQSFAAILQLSAESNPALNQPTGIAVADDPIQERLYVADTGNNRVLVSILPRSDPLPVWNSVKQNLATGQIEAALTQFSIATADSYRILFGAIGNARLNQNMNAIGQLTPISIDDGEARYYFTSNIAGQPFLFLISFVNENGQWKIRNF